MSARRLAGFVAAMLMTVAAAAAQTPPAPRAKAETSPGPRGPRTPAPQSVCPRDAEPWTPSDFNSLSPALPTLVIAGDSTADKGPDAWHRGWAALIIDYFDSSKKPREPRARRAIVTVLRARRPLGSIGRRTEAG